MVNTTTDTPAQTQPLPDPATALAAVPVTEDLVEYTIACALALSPPELRAKIREHIAHHTSAQVRRVFGGDRIYISRRAGEGRSDRNAAIKRDYWQNGERIPLLERRYSLSARQLWYIIKA